MATLLVLYISKITGITFIKNMVKSMILLGWNEQIRKGYGFREIYGEFFDSEKFYCKCSIFLFIFYFIKSVYIYFTLSLGRVFWGFSCWKSFSKTVESILDLLLRKTNKF